VEASTAWNAQGLFRAVQELLFNLTSTHLYHNGMSYLSRATDKFQRHKSGLKSTQHIERTTKLN